MSALIDFGEAFPHFNQVLDTQSLVKSFHCRKVRHYNIFWYIIYEKKLTSAQCVNCHFQTYCNDKWIQSVRGSNQSQSLNGTIYQDMKIPHNSFKAKYYRFVLNDVQAILECFKTTENSLTYYTMCQGFFSSLIKPESLALGGVARVLMMCVHIWAS